MDSWTILNGLLNALTMFNCVLTITISVGTLVIIIIFHRRTQSVSILLASHTCFTILLSAIVLLSMTTSSLLGFTGVYLSNHGNTVWCRLCGFCIHGFLCVLYDAYVLQAIFRFFRVIFHRRRILHSFKLYCMIIPFEAIFALMCMSPILFFNRVVYLPSEFYCQTPFTDLPAILYTAGRLYGFPLMSLSMIYCYLVRYIRRISPFTEAADARLRVQNNTRDIIVIKRLLIILFVLLLLGIPSIMFLIISLFTGYLPALTYRIGWFTVSFSLILLSLIIIKLTGQLRGTVERLMIHIGILRGRIAPQQLIQIRYGTNGRK